MRDEIKKRSYLKRFIKLIYRRWRPIYSSKLTHLKIFDFNSFLNKSIKGIVHMFSNIIHLDFEKSIKSKSISKVLKLIVESYSNLKYFNISAFCRKFAENNKSLYAIANSYC